MTMESKFSQQIASMTLRSRQDEARKYIYSNRYKNLLLVLPTGYGKTAIGKMAIDRAVQNGEKVIWCAPLKALTNEQVEDFSKTWKTLVITGDTFTKFEYDNLAIYDVFIFTYEKLLSVLMKQKYDNLFFDQLEVSTVVIDEIHTVGSNSERFRDPTPTQRGGNSRGASLEQLIVELRDYHPFVHIVGLSATIGNYEEIGEWLDAKVIYAGPEERPIPLKIRVKPWDKTWNAHQDMMVRLRKVEELMREFPNSKILCFCTSIARTKQFAWQMAPKGLKGGIEKLMDSGFGYHNSSLSKGDRKEVEDRYRSDPNFRVLFSTPTLAQGINLPADICVMMDFEFWSWLLSESFLMEENLLHQMIGRAGRPGMSEFGLAVLMPHQDIRWEVERMASEPVEVRSQMLFDIKIKILETFAKRSMSKHDLFVRFGRCLDPIEDLNMEIAFGWLLDKKFITETDGIVKNTFLGRMTAYAFIQPETALHMRRVCHEFSETKFDNVGEYIKLFPELLNTGEFLDNLKVTSGSSDEYAVSMAIRFGNFKDDRIAKAFILNFKETLIRRKLITLDSAKNIKVTKSEIYVLRELLNRFCVAASMVCNDKKGMFEKLRLICVKGELSLDFIKILELPGIGDKRGEKLYNADIRSPIQFLASETKYLAKMLRMSPEKIDELKEMIEK